MVVAQNNQYGATQGVGASVMQPQMVQQPGLSDQVVTGQALTAYVNANAASAPDATSSEEKTAFWITPKFGVSNMAERDGLNTQGRYSAGIGFGVGISENVSFDLGYQFSEYGVGLSNSNPYLAYQPYGYNANTNARSYKQNVVDAGIKLHFLVP